MKYLSGLLLTVLASVLLLGQPAASSSQHHGVLGYASSMGTGELVGYTNDQRAAYGEGGLSYNGALASAAQAKANDMVSQNYWSHYSPSGTGPWTFILGAGYNYSAAGENLAYGYDSAADVINAWMNSPEHRANILNGGYSEVGFGVANSADYVGMGPETIVVAEYGTPAYTPAPAPAYTAPSTPASTPVSTVPADTPAASPTDTAPAPPAAPPAAPTTPKVIHQPAKSTSTKKQTSNQSGWVSDLRSGELKKNAHLNLSASKISDSLTIGGIALASALALFGQALIPTKLR